MSNLEFKGIKKGAFDLLQSFKEDKQQKYNKEEYDEFIRIPFKAIQSDLFEIIKEDLEEYNLTDKSARSQHAARNNELFHHFWAAIYRSHRKNKSDDIQHFWYICEDLFKFGLYSGYGLNKLYFDLLDHIFTNKDKLFKIINKISLNGKKLKIVSDSTHGFLLEEFTYETLTKENKNIQKHGLNFIFDFTAEEVIELGPKLLKVMKEGFQQLKPLYRFIMEVDPPPYDSDKVLDLFAKLSKIKMDRSSGSEKLYKPCLLLAGINQKKNYFEKPVIKQEYEKVRLERNVELGSSFENPFNGLVNDGLWHFQNDEKSVTAFSDEDWDYITANKDKVEQFILDRWFSNKLITMGFNLEKGFPAVFRKATEVQSLKLDSKLGSNFCCSLLSKPFLILTGLSGSGKTQIARTFSKWLCESHKQINVVAIGADWTSNENLLGYPDALKEKSYRKPDNGALDLILNAQKDSENPYFLILDEMNLSHVERYFADFLSALESGEPINLHDDTGSDWDGVPAKLTLPKNLFVIGTVNVDETTYMFSPKVLDRANVIEFRVTESEISTFLDSPQKPKIESLSGLGAMYAKDFVKQASSKEFELEPETKKAVNKVLTYLFPELQKCGAEFGYRTAYEISRFIYFHQKYSEESVEDAIDAALMQKILPKLHGSRKKLGPVLETLLESCVESKDEENKTVKYKFETSAHKIERMQKRLLENGFTSFAEA